MRSRHFIKRVKGMTAFMLTAVLLLGFAPFISTYAADGSHYQWDSSSENISYVDLSTYFGKYEGSFVLYDLENDAWSIHDMEHATLRVCTKLHLTKYMMPCSDWKRASLHQMTP